MQLRLLSIVLIFLVVAGTKAIDGPSDISINIDSSFDLTEPNSVVGLSWAPVPGALSYNIYLYYEGESIKIKNVAENQFSATLTELAMMPELQGIISSLMDNPELIALQVTAEVAVEVIESDLSAIATYIPPSQDLQTRCASSYSDATPTKYLWGSCMVLMHGSNAFSEPTDQKCNQKKDAANLMFENGKLPQISLPNNGEFRQGVLVESGHAALEPWVARTGTLCCFVKTDNSTLCINANRCQVITASAGQTFTYENDAGHAVAAPFPLSTIAKGKGPITTTGGDGIKEFTQTCQQNDQWGPEVLETIDCPSKCHLNATMAMWPSYATERGVKRWQRLSGMHQGQTIVIVVTFTKVGFFRVDLHHEEGLALCVSADRNYDGWVHSNSMRVYRTYYLKSNSTDQFLWQAHNSATITMDELSADTKVKISITMLADKLHLRYTNATNNALLIEDDDLNYSRSGIESIVLSKINGVHVEGDISVDDIQVQEEG